MNTDLIEDAITEFRAKAKTVMDDADTYDLMADCLTRLLKRGDRRGYRVRRRTRRL